MHLFIRFIAITVPLSKKLYALCSRISTVFFELSHLTTQGKIEKNDVCLYSRDFSENVSDFSLVDR